MTDTPNINIGTGLSWRSCTYACLFFFFLGIGMGVWGCYTWNEDLRAKVLSLTHQLKSEKDKPPVVKETVKTVTDTQIAYVPKETIIYKDPVSGQESQKPLDGKFEIGKQEFVFTVNGKPGKFTRADDERYVFEHNMMLLTQNSKIHIEAEIPTIDKTKYGAVGIGYGTHGLAGKLDIRHVWLYCDKETKAGGLQFRF